MTTRRVVATAALAFVPVIITGALAAAREPSFNILLFQALMVPLFLQVLVIFVVIVNSIALVREEIDDQTLVYLTTRPISKPSIATYKFLGSVAANLILLVPPLILAYVITVSYAGGSLGSDRDVLAGFLLTTALGVFAYGSFFGFLSVLLRKPLAVGLLFGFVWESIVGSIPGDVPKLSIIHYLKSILRDTISVGPLTNYPTDLSAGLATGILVAFVAAMLVVTALVFQNMEFKQKE